MEAVYCNSLAGGRIKLKRIVRDMMARKDKRNLVLEVDPGVGKTRTALQQAANFGHQRKILYSAPNHALVQESFNRFSELPGHPAAHYMYGRNEKNCLEFNKVKEANQLGYFPAAVVCGNCTRALNCEYNAGFAALKNSSAEVVFCTTQQAIKVLGVMDGRNSLWIVDEPGLQHFVDKRNATTEDFSPYHGLIGPECLDLIQTIRTKMEKIIAQAGEQGINKPHIRGYLYGQQSGNSGVNLFQELDIEEETARSLFSEAILRINQRYGWVDNGVDKDSPAKRFEENLHNNVYHWLQVAAGWSDTLAAYVEGKDNRITFSSTSIPIREKMNKTLQILVLDGTHYPETMSRIFNREFAEIRLQTETTWKRRVFAFARYGKEVAVKDKEHGFTKGAELLNKVTDEVKKAGNRILLVTYMAVEEQVLAYCQQAWPEKEWASEHFGNIRGKNTWEEFDAVLLLGCPTPHPQQSKDDSDLIFPDDPEKNQGYRSSLTTAEIIQAVHRIRPVNNPGKRTVIICGREWPEELGTPDRVYRQKPGLRNPALKAAFERASGWIEAMDLLSAVRFDQEIGWLLGISLPNREKAVQIGRQQAPELIDKFQQEVNRAALPTDCKGQEKARRALEELAGDNLEPINLGCD
ncbi:MAG: DEAD/DEAH box helicase family protein [Candidatus Electrothrix sp. YB6]